MFGLQQYDPSGLGFVPQQFLPQSFLGQNPWNRPIGNTYGCGPTGSLGQRNPFAMLPFDVDPVVLAALNAQAPLQAQLAPQGIFSNLLGRQYANTYGCGPSGSLGQRIPNLLPFGVDPVALAYARQAQLAPQGWLG
jgi:hypothetical protein